jgi:hypothetical protein
MHMSPKSIGSAPRSDGSDSLVHLLHSLLSCMRCITQHEDALCELLHEAQHGAASGRLRGELLTLVEDLPSSDYVDDLDRVRDMLGKAPTTVRVGRNQRKGARLSAAKKLTAKKRKTVAAPAAAKNTRSHKSKLRKSGRKPYR